MFGIPIIFLIIIAVIIVVMAQCMQDKNQKRAQEKVIELTEKGHDANLCPKCKGKGGRTWGEWANCPECGGLGYIYKLKEGAKGRPNPEDKAGL